MRTSHHECVPHRRFVEAGTEQLLPQLRPQPCRRTLAVLVGHRSSCRKGHRLRVTDEAPSGSASSARSTRSEYATPPDPAVVATGGRRLSGAAFAARRGKRQLSRPSSGRVTKGGDPPLPRLECVLMAGERYVSAREWDGRDVERSHGEVDQLLIHVGPVHAVRVGAEVSLCGRPVQEGGGPWPPSGRGADPPCAACMAKSGQPSEPPTVPIPAVGS